MDLRDEMMLQKANKKMAKERKKEMKQQGGKKSPVRKIVLGVLIFLAAVLLVALVYVAYVFIAYYRIEDNKVLTVENNGNATGNVETGREYTMVSYNIQLTFLHKNSLFSFPLIALFHKGSASFFSCSGTHIPTHMVSACFPWAPAF